MTTYHVLDANQPNPDKLIADAARNARSVIRKAWALGEEIGLTDDEEDLLLRTLLLTFDNDLDGPQL